MPDVTTSEIQNRITDLKAELDRLSFQLACAQSSAMTPDIRPVPFVGSENRDTVRSDAVQVDSVRSLRDLMWQGRWGLAFHLARALEAQGVGQIDFGSSTIRAWALASQSGRRNDAESLRLAEELLQGADAAANKSLAPRLLEWAALIGLARGLESSQVQKLAKRFSPPEELPATTEWWRNYIAALIAARRRIGKWAALPDQDRATSEVDELVLRSEVEPIRLAASCLMMSIRSAMRYVQMLSIAEERFILNAELARTTSLKFTDEGEISSPAEDVERAVCEIAKGSPRSQPLMMEGIGTTTEDPVSAVSELVNADELLAAPTPGPEAALIRIEAVQQSLESVVSQELVDAPPAAMPMQQMRQLTARERLERYAERLAVQEAARLVVASDQLVVLATEDGASATPSVASRVQPQVEVAVESSVTSDSESRVVAAAESPIVPPDKENVRVVDQPTVSPVESNQRVEEELSSRSAYFADRKDRRGIHEAALATAFGGDVSGQRSANSAIRSAKRGSAWGILMTPQAAIVAGLLVIAGAVIVGLGTGLAAKDMIEIPAPLKEEAATPSAFGGDFPTVE